MKKYTLNFWLLSLSSFLFFGSFNMVLPELPSFMRMLGGEQYIGLHITFFTITALISRPFSGKLTDTWGRIPVMVFGCLVTAVVSLVYPFFLNIYAFLFIRFIHGFSTGFKPTGTAAYVADIVSAKHRGEGMGILSFFGMVGMGLGNYIGGEIALRFSTDVLFFLSGGTAFLSVFTLLGLKETLPAQQKFNWRLLKINKEDLYEPSVLVPSVVMILVTFSFGTALTLIPDFSLYLGIENKGLYMFYFTVSSLVSRIVGGRLSDVLGRRVILIVAMLIISVGCIYTGFASAPSVFLTGAVIFGGGYGLSSPSLFAWAADLAPEAFRGRGFSTLFMALEIGIGMGAFLAGQFYGGEAARFPYIFSGCGGLAFVAFCYLLTQKEGAK